jgi:hypothetical protein
MSRMGKLVAIIVSIAVFVMPAATLPLHCIFKAPSGQSADPCRMIGMSTSESAEQVKSAPFDHSCCQVSAPRTESPTVPQSSAAKQILTPTITNGLLAVLPATPDLRGLPHSPASSPAGPPQAVLCTFLI